MSRTLAKVDLNLLVTMDVLLKEKNVSRAAEVLFVSQSAVSRALGRLRDTFDDPLFSRVSTGLVPTEKALLIEKQLLDVLPQLQEMFDEDVFDPIDADNSFALSLPTFLSSALIPKLMQRLSIIAPRVRVSEHSAKANPFTSIDQGYIDFSFHFSDAPSAKYVTKHLGDLRPQFFVRRSHPLTNKDDVSLKDTVGFPMVGMVVDEDLYHSFSAPISQIYKDLMLENHPMLRSSQTQVLVDVMLDSDSILFGTNSIRALRNYGQDFVQLPSSELDQNPELSVPIYLIHHTRCSVSPAHQWFEAILVEELTELLKESGS